MVLLLRCLFGLRSNVRDLEEKVRDTVIRTVPDLLATKYNLLANICHDSPPGQGKEGQTDPLSAGCYRAHVQNKATEQWYVKNKHIWLSRLTFQGLGGVKLN